MTAIQCVGQSLVDANSVAFSVTFSAAVTGVVPADFAVDGLRGTVTSVRGNGTSYTVEVAGIPDNDGTLGLEVLDTGTISDWFGTPLAVGTTIAVDQQYAVSRELYWDASDGNGPAGGSGAWSGLNWHVGSTDGPLQGWTDGSDAEFSGVPGTVTIAHPVVVGSLTFASGGWTLEGNTITLGPSPVAPSPPPPFPEGKGAAIDVATGTTIIDCFVSGAFVTNGDGELVLSGGIGSCPSVTVNGDVLNLGGAAVATSTVTLTGGSIVNGTLNVATTLDLYSGAVLVDITGTAVLDKLGANTVLLAGDNTYSGGTNALDGTLIATHADSLPGTATGPGTVVVQPTLYWSGSGDWTGQWELADGTPTPWIDGSSVVIAAGSAINVPGSVQVSAITIQGDATISGGTLALPSLGSTIDVLSGTATIASAIAGGGFTETGPGTLVLDGAVSTPPTVVDGQAIGPGAVFASDGESLYQIDPAMFNLVQSLFVDQSINRTDMIQILESAVVDGAVSPAALEALETLTTPQNEARLNMPDYVAVLANDVVEGNPANADYQGQPLGNLAGQESEQAMATALDDLVGKWFYGTDLPAIPAPLTYSAVAGSLFGDAPSPL